MSNELAPLVVCSIFGILSGIFPAFCTFRFVRHNKDVPVASREKYINYTIISCLICFHVCEGVKATYFGLEYSQTNALFNIISRVGLKVLIDLLAECSHILLIFAVLQRMTALIVPTKQFGLDENQKDIHILLAYGIAAIRVGFPVLAIGNFLLLII